MESRRTKNFSLPSLNVHSPSILPAGIKTALNSKRGTTIFRNEPSENIFNLIPNSTRSNDNNNLIKITKNELKNYLSGLKTEIYNEYQHNSKINKFLDDIYPTSNNMNNNDMKSNMSKPQLNEILHSYGRLVTEDLIKEREFFDYSRNANEYKNYLEYNKQFALYNLLNYYKMYFPGMYDEIVKDYTLKMQDKWAETLGINLSQNPKQLNNENLVKFNLGNSYRNSENVVEKSKSIFQNLAKKSILNPNSVLNTLESQTTRKTKFDNLITENRASFNSRKTQLINPDGMDSRKTQLINPDGMNSRKTQLINPEGMNSRKTQLINPEGMKPRATQIKLDNEPNQQKMSIKKSIKPNANRRESNFSNNDDSEFDVYGGGSIFRKNTIFNNEDDLMSKRYGIEIRKNEVGRLKNDDFMSEEMLKFFFNFLNEIDSKNIILPQDFYQKFIGAKKKINKNEIEILLKGRSINSFEKVLVPVINEKDAGIIIIDIFRKKIIIDEFSNSNRIFGEAKKIIDFFKQLLSIIPKFSLEKGDMGNETGNESMFLNLAKCLYLEWKGRASLMKTGKYIYEFKQNLLNMFYKIGINMAEEFFNSNLFGF